MIAFAAAILLFGCGTGNTSAGQTPDAGGGSVGTAQHALHVSIIGKGEVRASNPAFSCRTDCTQAVDATATVHLVALPDSGWKFDGWQGSCTGVTSCDLAMSSDQSATATFSVLLPPPPGTVRVTVSPTGSGSGRVTSAPVGIDCPGTCSTTVQAGTSLSLNATPDASSGFAGWGGGCSGPGACTVAATADVTVYANFSLNAPPPPPPPPPTNACAGIPGPDAIVMQQYVARPNRTVACLAGLGDKNGTLDFPMSYMAADYHGSLIDFVTAANIFLREDYFQSEGPNPIQQPIGLFAAGSAPHLYPYGNAVDIARWDTAGNMQGEALWHVGTIASAGDPTGGLLVAGDIGVDASSMHHEAHAFVGGPGYGLNTKWTQPLASSGPVFGAGVDVFGRSIVITGGASGSITAQWFEGNGTPLTGEFRLLDTFTPGANTWFETSPLIGGGVVVRRMDLNAANGTDSHMLVTVDSGTAGVHAAPQWMVGRNNTRLQITRGGMAYAVLPYGVATGNCSEHLEIVASDGTSCGARDYPIAAGTCNTMGLTLAEDGTVMQQLPSSMELIINSVDAHTCTWRFWTRAAQ